jgi:hypothetical protein
MKATLFALLTTAAVLGAGGVKAEDATGAWAGAIDDHMAVLVHIDKAAGGYTGRFEAHEEPVSRPDPKAFSSVVEAVSATPDHLAFAVPVVGGQFDAHWDMAQKAWVGTFRWGPGGYVSQITMSRTTAATFADLPLPPPRPDGPPDTARMDEVIQAYVANEQFMGTVLVTKHGKVVFDKAYWLCRPGMADPDDDGGPAAHRFHDQAVHCRVDPAARRARQAEDRRPHQDLPAGRAGQLGQDHHP